MPTAVFLNLPAHGHINPTLPIVRDLIARGHTIYYYCHPDFQAKIESSGATFRPYPDTFQYNHHDPNGHAFELATRILQSTVAYLPDLTTELRDLAPDYLFHDSLAVWGKYLAQRLNIPAISSTATFAINAHLALRYAGLDAVASMFTVDPHFFVGYLRAGLTLFTRYGIIPPSPNQVFSNPAPLTLVYTSRHFQPAADSLAPGHVFVGPSIPIPATPPGFPLDWCDHPNLIYVALGTLFNNRPDFFKAVAAAFADSPYRVVMAIGDKLAVSDLGDLPANVRAFNFVPQFTVLQRARLFITHGGMNSVSEGLYLGVPLLVYPQIIEQRFNAGRATELGAAHTLRNADITPERIRAHAEQVLADPNYTIRAAAIGESFRAAGGPPAAIAAIEHYLTTHHIPLPTPA